MKINCGNCQKTIATKKKLIEIKCRHCGAINCIDAETGKVTAVIKKKPRQ